MERVDLPRPPRSRCRQVLWRGDLEVGLVHVVEEGKEPVILALGDRVVLVVVALGTADGQAQEDGPGRVDPIDDRLDPELLDVDPPLLVDLRIAMEPGGDLAAIRSLEPGYKKFNDCLKNITVWLSWSTEPGGGHRRLRVRSLGTPGRTQPRFPSRCTSTNLRRAAPATLPVPTTLHKYDPNPFSAAQKAHPRPQPRHHQRQSPRC